MKDSEHNHHIGREGIEVQGVLTGQVPVRSMPIAETEPKPPACPNHKEVQHRDGKPPWCNRCGWKHGRPTTPPVFLGVRGQ